MYWSSSLTYTYDIKLQRHIDHFLEHLIFKLKIDNLLSPGGRAINFIELGGKLMITNIICNITE